MKSIDDIFSSVKNKDSYKATTTIKFKKDVYDLIDSRDFSGDILEIGCDTGNTTAVMSIAANKKSKKVYAFDVDGNRISLAKDLLKRMEIDNCEFSNIDVYNTEWKVPEIGFALIDCIHKSDFIIKDLMNVFKFSNEDVIIVLHDYGLVSKEGLMETSIALDKVKDLFEIVNFIGEQDNWNSLGSGKVVDWEGVVLRRIKND